MEKVFEIYIRTTPERLWAAITDPAIRATDSALASSQLDARLCLHLVHPGRTGRWPRARTSSSNRLPAGAEHAHAVERGLRAGGTSRVTWEIEPVGDSCRLTVTHDQLRDDAPAELYGGWPMILSGLKTWLETGQTLTTPGSLMYGENPST